MPPPPADGVGTPPAPPASGPGGRRGGRAVVLVAAVVAITALAAVALTFVRSVTGGSGGASTPTGAAEGFAAAVADGDALGMLSMVHPDEVQTLDRAWSSVAGQVEAAGAGDALPDGGIPGFEIEGLVVEEGEELAPGLVKVDVEDGTIRATSNADEDLAIDEDGLLAALDGSAQQRFDTVGAAIGGDGPTPLYRLSPSSEGPRLPVAGEPDELSAQDLDRDNRFIVVRKDGDRWYVSPLYTLAEQIRVSMDDAGRPDYGSVEELDGERTGADDPEAAVRGLAQAIAELDPEEGVKLLPPDEAAAAYDYVDAIVTAQVEADLEQERLENPIEIETLELRVEDEEGGTARVVIEEASFSAFDDYDGGRDELTIEDDCLVSEDSDGDVDEWCARGELTGSAAEMLPEDWYLVTRKVDGRWYVDPLLTIAQYLEHASDNADAGIVQLLMGAYPTEELVVSEPRTVEREEHYDAATYRVDLVAGTTYLVTVESDADNLDLSMQGPGGEGLVGDLSDDSYTMDDEDEDSAASLLVTATEDVAATLHLAASPDSERSDWADPWTATVTVAPIDTVDVGTLAVDTIVDGDLAMDGGTQLWTFDGTEGDALELTFDDGSPHSLSLFDPEGHQLETYGMGSGGTLPATGRYLVAVTGPAASYTLTLQRWEAEAYLPSCAPSMTPLEDGDVVSGTVDGTSSCDAWFTDDGYVEVYAATDYEPDIVVTLYDQDGNELGSDSGYNTGIYASGSGEPFVTIVVQGSGDADRGAYNLGIGTQPPMP